MTCMRFATLVIRYELNAPALSSLRALTAALGLRLRRRRLVRSLHLVADDRLQGAEREGWTTLATDGESDGAESHVVLLGAGTAYTPRAVGPDLSGNDGSLTERKLLRHPGSGTHSAYIGYPGPSARRTLKRIPSTRISAGKVV